ncbi:MAG: hypothetical protein WBP40_02165 [Candidatus Moraniibacteriota bacterium]|nr:MAG: hypothetical protein IPJ68_05205 [Candidatus Moranbacteria bacterium]
MKLLIEHPSDTTVTLFRRAGYIFQREEGTETSFIRPLGSSGYPRFHCYVKSKPDSIECSIHLDQKRETYGRTTRHHGEYEDAGALADEIRRIQPLLGVRER